MKAKSILPYMVFLLILSGCSLIAPAEPTPLPPATETQQATKPVIATSTLVPSPTFTPSPTPFVPFEAHVMVDNTNLRTGPGYLFLVSRMINQGVTFQVLGKSRGGEWIYIQTTAGYVGWVFAQLIQTDRDLQVAPEVQPEDVQLITGKVTTAQGDPVSGIQYAITQGSQRTDAMTGADGIFYAFLPKTASGKWSVTYTAISCKSNTMDANCNCKNGICGTSDPLTQNVTLPQMGTILFTWK